VEDGHGRGRGTEWNAIRKLLAHEARTPMGRERAEAAEPLGDPTAVRAQIELTGEARRAVTAVGPPPLDATGDVRPLFERCQTVGSVLDGPELVQLLPVLDTAPRLAAYGRSVKDISPQVAARTGALPVLRDLRQRLATALDETGSVLDDASVTLRRLRREIRERRRRIVVELERAFQGADAERTYADRYVTVRHSRYVLPVRAEAQGRVRGIVHDRSQSGQTLFIEPEAIVEANNDLVQVVRAEEHETIRILAELTDAVRAHLDVLAHLVEALGALDWIFARAATAERMAAVAPVISASRRVAIRGARHPLLVAQSWNDPARHVVPVDLELDADRPLLVITGPNAGGKTIALKTMALLALLTQVGCHIPASEGSTLPVFADIHTIIGDVQSVAENLSTFSAFVKQVREVLARADERSLVLLDELGAGTDPDEGAALAQAILEELAARGALVVATTHLEPLKAFAATCPQARNASVEFDTATLAPTFRLRYGHPGRSYALAIAGRLGLSPELIARAETHRSRDAARLGELIARLDAHTRSEADRALAAERQENEAAARLAAAREAESAAARSARNVLEQARADASALLADVRRAVAAEWDRLKRTERTRRSLEQSRSRLADVATRIDAALPAAHPEATGVVADTLTTGATVAAAHLGLRGELVSISGDSATVRCGAITVRVPLAGLRPVATGPGADATAGSAGPQRGTASRRGPDRAGQGPAARSIPPELMLIGQTTDEARDRVEQYLDDAFLAGLPAVRLIHGKGTGALRKAVRDLLASHPLVDSFRDGAPGEGGAGATVAALKVG